MSVNSHPKSDTDLFMSLTGEKSIFTCNTSKKPHFIHTVNFLPENILFLVSLKLYLPQNFKNIQVILVYCSSIDHIHLMHIFPWYALGLWPHLDHENWFHTWAHWNVGDDNITNFTLPLATWIFILHQIGDLLKYMNIIDWKRIMQFREVPCSEVPSLHCKQCKTLSIVVSYKQTRKPV